MRERLLNATEDLATLEIQFQSFQSNMYTKFEESSRTCSEKVKTQK